MKAQKNPTEVEGMKASHTRDSVALCDFLAFMEAEVSARGSYGEMGSFRWIRW